MKSKSGYHILTEEEFAKIKMLASVGFKPKQIAGVLGNNRSSTTITAVQKAKTLEEYRQGQRDRKLKYEHASKQTVILEAEKTPARSEVFTQPPISNVVVKDMSMSPVIDALNRIADTMDKLVVAWESEPKKRGIFG